MSGEFRIGEWLIQPELNRIRGPDRAVHLEPKVMDVLTHLADHPRQVLSKERIIRAVWGDAFVSDEVLTRAVSELRKAFGDDASRPQFIETIPRRGYRLIAPVSGRSADIDSKRGSGASTAAAPPRLRMRVLVAAAAAGVLLAAYFLRPAGDLSVDFQLANPVLLTTAAGLKDYPSWRPDGSEIAYQSDQSGNWDIWVSQVRGPRSVNLTGDHPGDDLYPSWSPDGTRIAFWSSREGGGEFVMPALGGRPRKLASTPADPYERRPGPAQWSPDGAELAFVRFDPVEHRYYVEIVSVEQGTSRRLPLQERFERDPPGWEPSWSPDGRFLAYSTAYDIAAPGCQLWILRLEDLAGFPLMPGREYLDLSPSWGPEGHVFFVSNRGGGMDLWRLRLDENGKARGSPERLTTGVEMRYALFSPDYQRLAYSRRPPVSNVWRVPVLEDRAATWSDAQRLTFEQAAFYNLNLSPDGSALAFTLFRPGRPRHIWLLPADRGDMVRLLADPMLQIWPGWSPDGREIVFHSEEGDRRNIWLASVAGGPARNLTQTLVEGQWADFMNPLWSPQGDEIAFISRHGENWDIWVVAQSGDRTRRLTEGGGQTGGWMAGYVQPWSPDGREIVFTSGWSGQPDLWIVPVDGGEPRQLTDDPARDLYPNWSPDGRWILFSSDRTGDMRIWKVRPVGGEPEPVTGSDLVPAGIHGPLHYQVRWSVDGSSIFFAAKRDGVEGIYVIPADGGPLRQLADFRGKRGRLVHFDTDGQHIYVSWDETKGEIWVMDVVR